MFGKFGGLFRGHMFRPHFDPRSVPTPSARTSTELMAPANSGYPLVI